MTPYKHTRFYIAVAFAIIVGLFSWGVVANRNLAKDNCLALRALLNQAIEGRKEAGDPNVAIFQRRYSQIKNEYLAICDDPKTGGK